MRQHTEGAVAGPGAGASNGAADEHAAGSVTPGAAATRREWHHQALQRTGKCYVHMCMHCVSVYAMGISLMHPVCWRDGPGTSRAGVHERERQTEQESKADREQGRRCGGAYEGGRLARRVCGGLRRTPPRRRSSTRPAGR